MLTLICEPAHDKSYDPSKRILPFEGSSFVNTS
jgi:hypothetical protein